MTVILLPSPELQFCDAIGAPYAAGTIETYIPATSTPKATWNDPAGGGGHLNTNPIVLDSAGRAIIYGDGAYRLVLRDAAGNRIWDAVTSSVVSAAMLPVVQAATIPDAIVALGIQALIDTSVAAEATTRASTDAALSAGIIAETVRAEAEETALSDAISVEATARGTADTTLQGNIDTLAATVGGLPTNSAGSVRAGSFDLDSGPFDVTFSPVFPTACVIVGVSPPDLTIDPPFFLQYATLSGTRVTGTVVDGDGIPVGGPITWYAIGF